MDVEIVHGLQPDQIGPAAQLYADAFGHYFGVTRAVYGHRRSIIEDAIDPGMAFAAVAVDGSLIGVAGYQHDGRHFLQVRLGSLARRLGWWQGVVGAVLLSYLERPHQPGQLVMDGIAVSEAARGQGIGTRLLEALAKYAGEQRFREVRLDVVDTNPDAKRLYERVGFTEVERTTVPRWFARRVGFGAASTLVRPLAIRQGQAKPQGMAVPSGPATELLGGNHDS